MITSRGEAVVRLALAVAVVILLLLPLLSSALDIHHIRQLAAKNNVTCVLVFGDSTVDPGNNNRLDTTIKSNFLPYGKDFFNGSPTGRFSNGRLATDFIGICFCLVHRFCWGHMPFTILHADEAEAIGYIKAVPAYLDPNLKTADLLHGVSFASAASGYDDLTANLSNVLPVSKQLEYFKHYKLHLSRLVGDKKAEDIVKYALFILSMGTNDFLQNYYIEPTRPQQYTMAEYQNYLASRLFQDIKEMHRLGATRLAVVGVPPFGCIPLVKTLMNQKNCVESYNQVVSSFNSKIKEKLAILRTTLGVKAVYVDCFSAIENIVNYPERFGFSEVSKGCLGSGTTEYGESCRGVSVCADTSKYAFWDAVHPTERMYQIIANEALEAVNEGLLQL